MTDTTTTPDDDAVESSDPVAFTCPHCGTDYRESDSVHTETVITAYWGGRYRTEEWCYDCYCNDATCVDDDAGIGIPSNYCDSNVVGDFFNWNESAGEYCTGEVSDDNSLMDYSTDVIDVLGWPNEVRFDALCFGVELEMESCRSYSADDIVERLGGSDGTVTGTAILKRDGSLADGRGVELVTLPATLEMHRNSGQWKTWLSLVSGKAQSGAGTTNCGMHVHINRAALSPLTVGKLVVFLNNPANEAFVTTVAQRRSGGYCNRDQRKAKVANVHRFNKYGGRDSATDFSRYDIINVTGGNTVEVRMFRGNLRPERVLKNLEFCHALVRFCETSGINQAASYALFLDWLNKNRRQYPHLIAFLQEKDYIARPVIRGEVQPVQLITDC